MTADTLAPYIAPAPNDPPAFLLMASPSWGPASWLPDSVYQKVFIGATGQVLTVQADGSINWQNSAAGFSNPMTTPQDLIVGGTAGLATRLPIGSPGQVLTDVGGVIAWANPVTGFANPMTTTGDIIYQSGGVAVRLPVGSASQVLTVAAGIPAWSTNVGFNNPMTTTGDSIIGGIGGIAQRLAAGGAGNVLTMVSGSPAWANAVGFANPMTTPQDLIVGGTAGAAGRLAVGANGQVLGVTSGAVGWVNNPAGFTNPMTQPQDLIVGGTGGAATRLPAGSNGQVLSIVGGAVGWQALPATASPLAPSGDLTGATDTAAINNALTATGFCWLGVGQFYVKSPAGVSSTVAVTVPYNATLVGSGEGVTFLNMVNNGIALSMHNPSAPVSSAYVNFIGGSVSDLTIDGTSIPVVSASYTATNATPCVFTAASGSWTNGQMLTLTTPPTGFIAGQPYFVVAASGSTFQLSLSPGGNSVASTSTGSGTLLAGSVGVNIGDAWGLTTRRVRVQNVLNGVAWWVQNQVAWTEKTNMQATLSNCAVGVIFDGLPGRPSHEYNHYDFDFDTGVSMLFPVIIQNGAFLSASTVRIVGNVRTSGTFLVIQGNNAPVGAQNSYLGGRGTSAHLTVETGGSPTPTTITCAALGNTIVDSTGSIAFGNAGWVASTIVAAQFKFGGVVVGDANLVAVNTAPAGWV